MATCEMYDKILKVSWRLLAQQGYTATSMRQGALEAGTGKATIYHHIPDKPAIVTTRLQKSITHLGKELELIRPCARTRFGFSRIRGGRSRI